MPYLVGWKADGDLGYVSRDAKRAATFIAIDPRRKKPRSSTSSWSNSRPGSSPP
jgi:hypothetical protein